MPHIGQLFKGVTVARTCPPYPRLSQWQRNVFVYSGLRVFLVSMSRPVRSRAYTQVGVCPEFVHEAS